MNPRTPAPNCDPDEFRDLLRADHGDDLDLSVDRDGCWTVYGDLTQEALETFVAERFPGTTDPDDAFRTAVQAATSIADLKVALLGTTGPGAEPRRPPR